MLVISSIQLHHLFLDSQATIDLFLIESMTNCESVSNQRLSQPLEKATSMAMIAANSYALKE